VKLALVLVLVLTTACKEKAKANEAARAPARAEPVARSAEPRAPSPALPPPAPPAPPPADAADPIDAPPTRSELALAARGEFLGKVNKTAKLGGGDCAGLITQLESLMPEARAMAQRRTEVSGAEIAQDDAMVTTSLRALTRIVSACPEKDRFDAFLNVLGDVPK